MSISLKNYYNKQKFDPGLIGLFINPFFIARKGLIKNIKSMANEIDGLTLDIGCGNKPYEHYFKSTNYLGVDVQTSIHNVNTFADFFYNGKTIPVKNNQIDSIVCNQVFEHVFEPQILLSEISRVLKLDGKLLITLPFVWDEHEQPYDYARYSSYGIHYLLKKYGFEVITSTKTAKDFSVFAQLLNLYIYKQVHKRNALIKKIVTLMIMAPITIIGLLLSKILPDNEDLYLDNVILAIKINNT
jgi:SAM-dependent methyltransferase